MRDQPERLQRKREDARRVMGKMDRLYNSIRNLGIHYKLEENFGSTTITIGRNHHQFSGLYEDLRGGNLMTFTLNLLICLLNPKLAMTPAKELSLT